MGIDRDLLRIANTLVLNSHNIDNIGLLNGKLGIVIFLFHYARLRQSNIYREYAEDILQKITTHIGKGRISYGFGDGVCGIGWGIDYLIKHSFIEGEINDVLKGVDRLISNSLKEEKYSDLLISDYLFDVGLYFCFRANGIQVNSSQSASDKIVLLIEKKLKTRDLLNVSLLNSMLYTVSQLTHFFDIESIKLNSIVNMIDRKLDESIEVGMYSNIDLFILEKLYSKTNPYIDNIKKKEINIDVTIDSVWQQLLYKTVPIYDFKTFHLKNDIDKMIINLLPENLTMKEGLAGLGLGLILNGSTSK